MEILNLAVAYGWMLCLRKNRIVNYLYVKRPVGAFFYSKTYYFHCFMHTCFRISKGGFTMFSFDNEADKERFLKYSQCFDDFTQRGSKKYKISKNAIKIAVHLKDELGIPCYPMVEKIATKGWSTSGGTFSWSIRRLDCGDYERELCSFEPTLMFIDRKYKLSIGPYNGFMVISADRIQEKGEVL